MLVRPARPSDLHALLRIGRAFYEFNVTGVHGVPLDEPSLIESLLDFMVNHVCLVLEVDHKVVGAAAGIFAPMYWNQAYIQGVEAFWWIDPEHRSKGNGLALAQALESAAKDKNCKCWHMLALESSDPDRVGAMYKSAGYEPVEHVYMKVL